MPIDYLQLSERYRPLHVTTLLVGEAPPPKGASYFYLPAKLRATASIRQNRSLPATIFHRYFKRLPSDTDDYESMLSALKDRGVFVMDLCDEPIRVRNHPPGLARIIDEIPLFRDKLAARKLSVDDSAITFLLARTTYRSILKAHFPRSELVRWIDFRMG
jgi:hypothetical protein